jgi:hypothetical protein
MDEVAILAEAATSSAARWEYHVDQ